MKTKTKTPEKAVCKAYQGFWKGVLQETYIVKPFDECSFKTLIKAKLRIDVADD